MRKNRLIPAFFSLALVATSATAINTSALAAGNPNCSAGDGDYIVSLQRGVSVDQELKNAPGGRINARFKYDVVLNGFAATLKAEQVCAFEQSKNVLAIEKDGVMTASALVTQTGATWGIDRIDERVGTDGTYTYSDTATANNVTAYVIDTGINSQHSEFIGRVRSGFTAFADGIGTGDCKGHGTHVSGTIGGKTYGVAKKVNLVAIRVLDCSGSGSYSEVVAGINWAANDFLSNKSSNNSFAAVANMSLGGGSSSSVNSAVASLVSAGVTVVVAAGNSNTNACNSSPASEPSAITVGATTSSDARASYSNYGSCLDIFAPGTSITSSWIGTLNTETSTISGTSMATPHVAGVAALYLSENPTATPAQVELMIELNATTNLVTSAGTGSPNLLLAAPTAAPVNAPNAPSGLVVTLYSPRKGVLTGTWSVSDSGSTSISKYLLTFTRNGSATSTSTTISSASKSGSYSYTGLISGASYTLSVTACNAQLCGQSFSNTASAK